MNAAALLDLLQEHGLLVATAESCTGGLVAAELTAVPGSSRTFERGFVTYSNAAKAQMLHVSLETLERHGAVSEATALEMVRGALMASAADVAVSITGVAGPDGGSEEKPVGLVWFGYARIHRRKDDAPINARAVEKRFGDLGRDVVRQRSVEMALKLLAKATDL